MPATLPASLPARAARMAARAGLALVIAASTLVCFVPGALAAADPPPPAPAGSPPATSASATDRRIEELSRQIEELKRQIQAANAGSTAPSSASLAEIERRIDVLAAEIEKLRSGSANEESALASVHGLGPAASKVYGRDHGVSFGGYGEALYRNFSPEYDDGSAFDGSDTLDLTRAVFYFGYKFDKGIVFNSEIEYEHATTGEGDEEKGEVSVEFAYLDFPLGKSWGVRAGQLLMPIGLINELHEPTVYLGAVRPDVETVIIPSTWREVGAGLYGEAGAITWRSYLTAGLNASEFTAEGIREGRQGGSNSMARDVGLSGRIDWQVIPGLVLGASAFTGGSGQGLEDADGATIEARTTLAEVHADFKARGFQARAIYAEGRIDDTEQLNAALGLTGSEGIGSSNHGGYVEAGYDVLSLTENDTVSLVPYARYERLDTQDDVADGYTRDPSNAKRIRTIGVGYRPIPNIVIKAEHQDRENDANTEVDRFHLALGWIF